MANPYEAVRRAVNAQRATVCTEAQKVAENRLADELGLPRPWPVTRSKND
jgi:hypothetical protein